MRTEAEVQAKLDYLVLQEQNFHTDDEIAKTRAVQKMLRWVLGIGPEPVYVPKPKAS